MTVVLFTTYGWYQKTIIKTENISLSIFVEQPWLLCARDKTEVFAECSPARTLIGRSVYPM